jgi:hypothetical protein
MSGYTPKITIAIAKPCSESWETMAGNASVRHCGSCDRDVRNVAAMTPAQIDAMLAQPGPLPCMRLVQFDDGSLLVARSEHRHFLLRASMALSTVMLMAGCAQTTGSSKPESNANLIGQVVDLKGKPIAHVNVQLWRKDKMVVTVETDDRGSFRLAAAPGNYSIYALERDGEEYLQSDIFDVKLQAGLQETKKAMHLRPVAVTVGDVVDVRPKPKLQTSKTKAGE